MTVFECIYLTKNDFFTRFSPKKQKIAFKTKKSQLLNAPSLKNLFFVHSNHRVSNL